MSYESDAIILRTIGSFHDSQEITGFCREPGGGVREAPEEE